MYLSCTAWEPREGTTHGSEVEMNLLRVVPGEVPSVWRLRWAGPVRGGALRGGALRGGALLTGASARLLLVGGVGPPGSWKSCADLGDGHGVNTCARFTGSICVFQRMCSVPWESVEERAQSLAADPLPCGPPPPRQTSAAPGQVTWPLRGRVRLSQAGCPK